MGRRRKRSEVEEPVFGTGQVMKRSGLSRQVLYQYTAIGLIKEADTTPAGYRLYPESVFQHLKIIRALNESGYTLRDIKDIFFARIND